MIKKETLAGVGIALVFGAGLSACASPSDISDIRAEMDNLSTRVSKIEKGSGGAGVKGSGGQLADMETRLDNQKLRIARLRDRMERVNHRLDELMNKIETQNAQGPQPLNAKAPSSPTATANPSALPAKPVGPVSMVPPAAGGAAVVASGAAVVKAPSRPSQSPDMIYHQAYADYQQGHYDIAIKEFSSLVEQYPDSHLASSAVFWEAQSHFNLKHYHRALALYDAVIHKYVDSPKKATAYYKKGQVYEQLNDRKNAIHNYRRVLELFPLEQQLGDLAKRRLSRLDE